MAVATLATATDIVAWAGRLESRSMLPQLIRRLVYSTTSGLKFISFRTAEGIQLGGWDGLVNTDQSCAFVPTGISGWEMGVSEAVKGKFDSDYLKRHSHPLANDPQKATFVFVTPRRWSKKGKWAKVRTCENIWKEVRVLDADDLESWLEQAPAVHYWFSTLLGKHPLGAIDGLSWWQDWSEVTNPAIRPDLLLAGREAEAQRVIDWIHSANTHLSIKADTKEEALAFFISSLTQLPEPDCISVLSRLLLVEDKASWRILSDSDAHLILAPLFEGGDGIPRALRNGHRVFVSLDRPVGRHDSTVELSRLARTAVKRVLIRMGISEDKADQLAVVARRSLMAFRRTLALIPEIRQPRWAEPSQAAELLPPLLVGSWNDAKKGDRQVVSKLAQKPYEEAKILLVRWANEEDPPLRNIGDIWYLVSKYDAWKRLGKYLTTEWLDSFAQIATDVLCTPDPKFDLPEENQWMAAAYGKQSDYSGRILKAIAETLAIMGYLGEGIQVSTGITVKNYAHRIVRTVLERANEDWHIWATISYCLQSLAEAAPIVLLEGVEAGLEGDNPPVLELFSKRGEDFLTSSHYYTGLLWALEVLAWSPMYLSRVSLILARLARMAPGGNMDNTPANSLRTIFNPWLPQTAADSQQRFRVIDSLRTREPDAAWELLKGLVPTGLGGFLIPNPKPDWHDWAPVEQQGQIDSEYPLTVRGVIDRVIEDAGDDPHRWGFIVDRLGSFRGEAYRAIVESLIKWSEQDLDDDDRSPVWHALRSLLSHHRTGRKSGGVLSLKDLDELDDLYRKIEPDSYIEKYSWLFDGWPDLPEGLGDDHKKRDELAGIKRLAAIEDVYTNHGLDGLINLAISIEPIQAHHLGFLIGKTGIVKHYEHAVFSDYLAAENKSLDSLAGGIVHGALFDRGQEWAKDIFLIQGQTWNHNQQAAFLLSLPIDHDTLDIVDREHPDTQDAYWQKAAVWMAKELSVGMRIVPKMINYNRPFQAIEVLGHLHTKEGGFPASFIVDCLEKVLLTKETDDTPSQSISYHFERLLDAIDNHPDVEQNRVAAIEWSLLSHRNRRPPRALHRMLNENPEFFVDVVSMQYRAKGEPPREATLKTQTMAEKALHLLSSWRTIPGQPENGPIIADNLSNWISQARKKLAAVGRAEIGDLMIGQVLSGSPEDVDGTWPHIAVREIIEDVASDELERGLCVGVYDSRGVTSRGLGEGGVQERDLAGKYSSYAALVQDQYPRTASILRHIAEHYTSEALRHDQSAEIFEDGED